MDIMTLVECARMRDADDFIMTLMDAEMLESLSRDEKVDWLSQFWAASRRPIRDVIEASKMTQMTFARHFCISARTVAEWSRGGRGCPIYTNLLLQEALGMFKRTP